MEGENANDVYRECLRNHAASLGSYATDGCGEFTLINDDNNNDNNNLQCAACGCHRNFHRRVTYAPGTLHNRSSSLTLANINNNNTTPTHHHHHPHHHHRHVISSGGRDMMMTSQEMMMVESPVDSGDRSGMSGGGGGRKRFRSKFTAEQKEKMLAFAEKLGWKLLRKDLEDEIERFCRSIGVSRQVFKVWMHNHKNLSSSSSASTNANNASSLTTQ